MVGVVAFGAPGMAIGRIDAIAIEVVEQDVLPRQGMMVGGDELRVDAQAGIAVALGHVPEHLVVGLVLLEDVKHVLENGRLAGMHRHWAPAPGRPGAVAGPA